MKGRRAGKGWIWIEGYGLTDLCVGIDFNAVNAVVDATHRYKEIFYDAE